MSTCFICKKHSGEIKVSGGTVYEDEYVYAGHIYSEDDDHYLGYMMIDLKRHAPGLGDMTDDESKAFGSLLNKLRQGLKVIEGAEHIYAFVAGDAVPHLHMHIIPRYSDTPEEYWGPGAVMKWPGARKGGKHDIEKVCHRLKEFLVDEKSLS
ncbi:HIT family protein [Cytobacillus purgationiresistens]|uniref:Diadenosine tetraphosphate (Ap4A) HIT family hydrolase n=1 Tax=Cytobacillus purgationiresistens TaxID=863449 RepID=A0ABU0AAR5_9BACI|nr:HIT family protein [Cytobacillus purgationiresistens]MDQ0268351.1 diadenosine tetraphosphate (Ap4A) HIT family hydrolase [Cytobacillus purgationiresistens]